MDLTTTLQYSRKRQGLSQVELAEALDVSRQTISKWETGAALPAAEHLHALSKLYGVTVDTLLNGAAEDAPLSEPDSLPDPAPLSVALPPAPLDEAKPNVLPRRKLVLWMLAAVCIFDLLIYPLDMFVWNLDALYTFMVFELRIVVCTAIGLWFARQDRFRPVNRKRSLLISFAVLSFAVYYLFFPAPEPFNWLFDQICGGYNFETGYNIPAHPLRMWIAQCLYDSYTVFSHMCLIAAFQLGRLWFSRKKALQAQPPLNRAADLPEWNRAPLNRRNLVIWMLAAVFICDFTAFFMDISLYSAKGIRGFLYYTQVFRLLSCCAIGLCFAWRDRFRPVSKRTSLLIAAAALVLGLYPALCSTPLLWRLYDWIVWSGFDSSELIFPPDPVRLFIGWTLCDSWAIFSHMSLIAAFQLGRLWFSRKKVQTLQPQTGQ